MNQGNPNLQALGHTHKIGVSQQCIEHITARLQIGNAIDGIEGKKPLKNLALRFRCPFQRIRARMWKQQIALGWCEQHAGEKVGVQNLSVALALRATMPKIPHIRKCAHA